MSYRPVLSDCAHQGIQSEEHFLSTVHVGSKVWLTRIWKTVPQGVEGPILITGWEYYDFGYKKSLQVFGIRENRFGDWDDGKESFFVSDNLNHPAKKIFLDGEEAVAYAQKMKEAFRDDPLWITAAEWEHEDFLRWDDLYDDYYDEPEMWPTDEDEIVFA